MTQREHKTETVDPDGPPEYFEDRSQEIGSLMKRFNTMRHLYRGPWAGTFERGHMLLLITTARTSGKPRAVALTFMPLGDNYVVGAGLGQRCDWYLNLLANPEVTVQIGARRFEARAEPVLDADRRRELMARMLPYWNRYGPPAPIRWLLRRFFRFDYDHEMAMAVAHAAEPPFVVLVPAGDKRVGQTAA